MGKQGTRTRSHAHGKRHGRLTLHLVVMALALGAVLFASQYPSDTSASTPTQFPSLAYSGVAGTSSGPTDSYLRPGTSLKTLDSVASMTRTADVASVRAVGGVSPTASFSAGVSAAVATSGVGGGGVTALADFIDPRKPFDIYKVQAGDTVSGVAQKYGILTGTLLDNNPTLGDGNLLVLGQELLVPLADGIMHKVGSGETLSSIVDQYDDITLDQALAFRANSIADPSSLEPGSFVLLPGATRKPPPVVIPEPDPVTGETPAFEGVGPQASGGLFSSPLLAYNGVSDSFGVGRGAGRIHEGIDLDLYGHWNSPIFAACSGTVSRVEYLTYSYGYHVIIDCGDGWTTLYAHMSQIDVVPGQYVGQGEALGYSGLTGFTTGEHLHFEIRTYGQPVNPAQYIPF